MAPSGSHSSVTTPPALASNKALQATYHTSHAQFDVTSLSLFQACLSAAIICAVMWTSISYIIVS